MDFTKIPLFRLITARIDWLSQRQGVLAQNVANVNSPGFKPKDLDNGDFARALRSLNAHDDLRVTHPRHISFKSNPIGKVGPSDTANPFPSPSGNAVVLEKELMKVGQTAMDYQLTTNLYRKQITMIRTALGRGGSS